MISQEFDRHSIRFRSSRHCLARTATALVALFLTGCGQPTGPTSRWAPAERIAGTWQWVRSIDVQTTQLHTPASSGFEASLAFAAESDRIGTFTYSRAGAAPITGSFTIASEDAPGNDFITVDPGFDFLIRNAWVAAGSDTLRLGGVFELGYNSTYARNSK